MAAALIGLALSVTPLVACGGSRDDASGGGSKDAICLTSADDCPGEQPYTGTPPTPFFPMTATAEAALTAAPETPAPVPSQTKPADPTSQASSPATPPADAGGCSTPRPHTAGDSNGSLISGGLDRTYILHVPPSYTGDVPMPLVINLHGYGSNAGQQALYSGLPALGDEKGFLVVSPNGEGTPQRWTFPGLGDVDEVAFIGELLDTLEETLCIDTARVYAAGMSNGAAITTFLACGLPDRIAAIAAVGATAGPRACATSAPIPIVTFRGTADACVPYQGGTSSCGMQLPVLAVEEVMRLWGEHNGCDATPLTAQVTEHVRTTSYTSCTGAADAILYTTEGDGHTWPGAINVPRLGHVTDEIDATAIMWDFFATHSR